MKAYNVHARLGRCDGFLMLPTALQSQIVEQVQSMLAAPAPASEAVVRTVIGYTWTQANGKHRSVGAAPHPTNAHNIEPIYYPFIAGDNADAPVQQAGVLTDAQIRKGFSDYDKELVARHRTPWQIWRDSSVWTQAALKGEQPVERKDGAA